MGAPYGADQGGHAHAQAHDVAAARAAGYAPFLGCVSGPQEGAMGMWAWKHNPHGTFVDWNPKVSCEDHTDAAR